MADAWPQEKGTDPSYLDPDVMMMLANYAVRYEQSQSMIAEAAIASFLSQTMPKGAKHLSPSASANLIAA